MSRTCTGWPRSREMLRYCEVCAPGKVILLGEHAVVYGRGALACSLEKCITCALTLDHSLMGISVRINAQEVVSHTFKRTLFQDLEGFNRDIRLPSPMDQDHAAALQQLIRSETHISPYEKLFEVCIFYYLGIASAILKDSNSGVIIEVTSELPFGSGLGSSASLSVAVASAFLLLCQVIELQFQNTDEGLTQTELSKKDLDVINAWAFEGEKISHGLPSGIDNTIITYGGMIHYKKGIVRTIVSYPEMEIILVYTGVSRNTNEIVMGLREKHEKFPRIYDAIFDAIEALTEDFSTRVEERKLNFNNQNDCEVLEDIMELIVLNHGLLRTLGVSHDSIEAVVSILKQHGFKGKLTGAGGGGCLFALIKPGTDRMIVSSTLEYIQASGYDCWKLKIGGSGVRCIKCEI